MIRAASTPILVLLLALAGCPARPKDEEGPDDGARESATTDGETGKAEPPPSV
jgi:hypothetical protein